MHTHIVNLLQKELGRYLSYSPKNTTFPTASLGVLKTSVPKFKSFQIINICCVINCFVIETCSTYPGELVLHHF